MGPARAAAAYYHALVQNSKGSAPVVAGSLLVASCSRGTASVLQQQAPALCHRGENGFGRATAAATRVALYLSARPRPASAVAANLAQLLAEHGDRYLDEATKNTNKNRALQYSV